MRAEHITLERPRSGEPRTLEIHVPLPVERAVPTDAVREVKVSARPARSLRYLLAASLTRFLVFEEKYRWYRGQGYDRAMARAKALWQARATPCPLAAPSTR